MIKIASMLGLGFFILGGCSLQSKVPPSSKYRLDVSTEVPAAETGGCKEKVLRLGLVESSALLMGNNIYYSSDNGQTYLYTKARWIEDVNHQLANLIERSVTKRGLFKDVIPLQSLAKNDLLLETNIYDFSQKIHEDGSTTLHLSVKLVLVEPYTRNIVATKFFEMEQKEKEGNIKGALDGYNTLVAQLLQETNSWLEESCSR
jgi:cholesterol transport system auxiliary component